MIPSSIPGALVIECPSGISRLPGHVSTHTGELALLPHPVIKLKKDESSISYFEIHGRRFSCRVRRGGVVKIKDIKALKRLLLSIYCRGQCPKCLGWNTLVVPEAVIEFKDMPVKVDARGQISYNDHKATSRGWAYSGEMLRCTRCGTTVRLVFDGMPEGYRVIRADADECDEEVS